MSVSNDQLLDCDRITASGLAARLEYHRQVPSTQDRCHELAKAEKRGSVLVVAESHTAGRGRGANRWWTGAGSLAFSLLFDPLEWGIPSGPSPQRSLATGVAIVDAVQPLLADHAVGLHWPNDVYVGNRKLAGILIDVLPDGRYVVGIGINVNNSLADAPSDVQARAVSLADLTGQPIDCTALLLDVTSGLKSALTTAAAAPREFGLRFQQLCLQLGRELTIEVGARRTSGRCAGIAPDGALLLETGDGWQRFYSGVLCHA